MSQKAEQKLSDLLKILKKSEMKVKLMECSQSSAQGVLHRDLLILSHNTADQQFA